MKYLGNDIYRLEKGDFKRLKKQATKTATLFYNAIKKHMKSEDAKKVRKLRIDEGHTWRSVAYKMYFYWEGCNFWQPISNQLAGMALCERAAEMLNEDYMKEQWN